MKHSRSPSGISRARNVGVAPLLVVKKERNIAGFMLLRFFLQPGGRMNLVCR